jgi:transposase-like protein
LSPFRLVYAIGVTLEGCKDIERLWASHRVKAKFWIAVVTVLRNRGSVMCPSWSAMV